MWWFKSSTSSFLLARMTCSEKYWSECWAAS
jgi:hypothetical protein